MEQMKILQELRECHLQNKELILENTKLHKDHNRLLLEAQEYEYEIHNLKKMCQLISRDHDEAQMQIVILKRKLMR